MVFFEVVFLVILVILKACFYQHISDTNICLDQSDTILKHERLKRRNTLGCLDQYAAQNSKYARPQSHHNP